ncbi:hypothetical protein EZV62_011428 [Acer yangbiense]|uniref:TF-B3 domain-containing protein n=1 Tax=Acer yangbiense TaxID=1000413 RepID=A0A5C7I5P4_9ROSI|nr:hypothetical protein EZV62_011428 [Acer yangbiense]
MVKSSNKRFPDSFKVYLPARNSHRLHIPDAFVAHCGKLLPKKGVLSNHMGNFWHVDVVKTENGVHFLNGWHKFVQDNSLQKAFDVSNFVQPWNPHFIAKLRTGTKKNLLHVPSKVLERHNLDLPDLMIFRNEQGRQWPGQAFRWNDGRMWISGWKDFCKYNHVGVDDSCICEFLPSRDGKKGDIIQMIPEKFVRKFGDELSAVAKLTVLGIYGKNSNFHVLIFDKIACEIRYPYYRRGPKTDEQNFAHHDEMKDDNSVEIVGFTTPNSPSNSLQNKAFDKHPRVIASSLFFFLTMFVILHCGSFTGSGLPC